MAYWRSLIDEHFVEDGSLQLTLTTPQSQNGKVVPAKVFEISAPSLPRYFWMQYDGQVEQIQIVLNGSNEKTINENFHLVRAEKARMLYWFKDGTQVCRMPMQVLFINTNTPLRLYGPAFSLPCTEVQRWRR